MPLREGGEGADIREEDSEVTLLGAVGLREELLVNLISDDAVYGELGAGLKLTR